MRILHEKQVSLLTDWIAGSAFAMRCLRVVRDLDLPDWAIGAGFVRSLAWDRLCGYATATPLPDIDVLFFDAAGLSPKRERDGEAWLEQHWPGQGWSLRNQARMHAGNGDLPYRDTADAIANWLETPTAVAVRLEPDNRLHIIAPHGLDDLLALRVRPTLAGQRRIAAYHARMAAKNWAATWPNVVVEGPT